MHNNISLLSPTYQSSLTHLNVKMFFKVSLTFLLIVVANFHIAYSAKILFFFVGGTYSHDVPIWPLAVRLADRNHSVTFYSAHSKKPWNDTRIKVISPSKIEEINSGYLGDDDLLTMRLKNQETALWKSLPDWSYEICEYILTNPEKPESKDLFTGEKFDLVIIDSAICDCGHIIAYYNKAKVIVSDSTSVLPWFHHVYGFPTESNWVPATSTFFQYPMSILNLVENYFEPFYWTYIRRTQFYPKLEALMKQLFKGAATPSFLELERRVKLIFVNTHPTVELPRSLPPNVIQIGGMQMWGQKSAAVPEELSNIIQKAEKGVILLAFGSAVDFSSIPESIEKVFFDAFKRFPSILFLVKATGSRPNHCPENLRYEKWIPQKEVLENPKTLACITHGGLNGILEATYLGVPLITIPIFAEQDHQSYKLQARGIGIRLELRDLNVEDLSAAISNITTVAKYRENMRKMQAAFRDRPETPLDLATYWTEYVLRHDDLEFMNPISYQPWTVYLEQYVFSTFSFLVAVFVAALMAAFSIKIWNKK